MSADFMNGGRRALKELYLSYGYSYYKLPGFEEYSLYAENRTFLQSADVIAFNAGGKLLALRPDVTLSVLKNARPDGGTQKLFYDEKVYRRSASGPFAETDQIGVEVIGEVDAVTEAEVLELMLGTLARVSDNYVLDISHVGVIEKLLDAMRLSGEDRAFATACLAGKNVHDFKKFRAERSLSESAADAFETLITLPAETQSAFAKLKKIDGCVFEEIEELRALAAHGGDRVNVNFSVIGDPEYYNGAVFRGYVEGVPNAVLSGGRYDGLAEKFGKSYKAVGFALYLGELRLNTSSNAPDTVLIYGIDGKAALQKAAELRKSGRRVLLAKELPANFSGEVIYAEGKND